jgi:filamentous hemagglutinin family protein
VQYDITGGTRAGTNLFHSFGNFNVPTNNIANFLNDSGLATSNILGRITGGNPSTIFGMIQTTGFLNANLFLMNPAGFLFGPNATLNVGGMVAFTTADYLRLADGVRFNAVPDAVADALLSSAPVAAFGFLGSNSAAIAIQDSTLTVAQGQTLSMVGGNKGFTATDPDTGNPIPVPGGITMTGGKLSAPGGQINIVSVAGPGEISAVDYMPTPGMTMGNISLSQGALLDVSADAAGTVRIRGGQLVMADATISADTVNSSGAQTAVDINITGDLTITDSRGVPAITARTTGTGDAGEVRISAGNFSASTTLVDPNFFHTLIDTHSASTGAAGSVNISTGDLKITGNPASTILTFIDTGPQADGRGGDVTINAQTIEMTGALISTGTFTADTLFFQGALPDLPIGSGGNLTINANTFFGNNAHFSTAGDSSIGNNQHAGDMTLNVHNFHFTKDSAADLTGDFGGGVTITADTFIMDASAIQAFTVSGPGKPIVFNGRALELNNGSTWTTSTLGDGAAGDIRVSASDHVSFIGQTGQNVFVSGNPTGIFSNSLGFFGSGASGNIAITTPRLTMEQGRINTTTLSSGGGGNVTINANVVEMSGELPPGTFVEAFFSEVGNVHPSGIFTQTAGSDFCIGPCGNAGNINIATGSLAMGTGSQINSGTTNSGQGGNVTINATDTISFSGTVSDGSPVGVFTRSLGTTPDAGAGGNITLTAGQSVTISDGAAISASSTGPGNTGNITINAGGQFAMTNASVTTEADQSGGGTIKITTNPNGTVQLTNSTISASVLDGTSGGGSVNIDPQFVILQNSQILAQAVQGPGGNISITTNLLLPDANSVISASSQFGQNGTITIQSPISPASGKIVPLSQKPLIPTSLLSQRCAALAGGNFSSFTVAGRDSLPAEPGGWLSSPLAVSLSESGGGTLTEAGPRTSLSEPAGEMPHLSLRQIAPPGFLTQAFAVDWSGCTS